MVVFEEVPNEITLAINITNCPCKCKDCHSKFLWDDVGIELTENEINNMIKRNDGITCVCFMGGDSNPQIINKFAEYVRHNFNLKTAWYSGRDELTPNIKLSNFNFVKIGHFDIKKGGLNRLTTNQKFYKIEKIDDDINMVDITNVFWKR